MASSRLPKEHLAICLYSPLRGALAFIGGLAQPLQEGGDVALGLGEAGFVGADEGVVVGGLVGDVHGVGVEDPSGACLFQLLYLVAELVVGLPARDGALGHDGMLAEGRAEERLGAPAHGVLTVAARLGADDAETLVAVGAGGIQRMPQLSPMPPSM